MNTDSAAARLQRLVGFLKADPVNRRLLQDAMAAAVDSGDFDTALSLLRHAEQQGISDPQIDAHALFLMLRAGDYAAAAAYGECALATGMADNSAVTFNTALAQFHTTNYSRAEELLRHAAHEAVEAEHGILHARSLHHLERPEEAVALLSSVRQQFPDNAEAKGVMALLKYETGHPAEASTLASEALTADPGQLDALLALGACLTESRQLEAAAETYQRTVDHHPECGRAWSGLGQVALGEFDFLKAEQALLKAVTYMPDHIGTWHMLAWTYVLRGDADRAGEAFAKSYDLDRNFGETHGGLAVVSAMRGNVEEARTSMRRAQRLAPEGMAVRYAEFLLLNRAGDQAAARKLVQDVLAQPLTPGGPARQVLVDQRLREMAARHVQQH